MMSNVAKALSGVRSGQFTFILTLDLKSPHKYIIFSDQHKGSGDRADDFKRCKVAYRAALEYYHEKGFTLILLGDAEELWEQGWKSVRNEYRDILNLEASFPVDRYFRLWGNHDDLWMINKHVRNKLSPYMPGGAVWEAIRFEVRENAQHLGTLLLLHGHQGTFESDKIRGLARLALRAHRYLQRWFKVGRQSPSKDECLSKTHETQMYNWADDESNLVLITGHTHHPIWSSKTHLQRLQEELEALRQQPSRPGISTEIEEKELEILTRERKHPPCREGSEPIPDPNPCYFNTGCCKFEDGDITGIELVNGELRLIKWNSKPAPSVRTLFEADGLSSIFASLT